MTRVIFDRSQSELVSGPKSIINFIESSIFLK